MKKRLIIFGTTLLTVAVLYFVGIGYYSEKFSANTEFGHVNISNLTLNQAQEKIESDLNNKKLIITENGKDITSVNVKGLNPTYEIKEELENIYDSQDPLMWVKAFFTPTKFNDGLIGHVEVDEGALEAKLTESGLNNDNRKPAMDAEVKYDDKKGYYIKEGVGGTTLDYHRLGQALVQSLQNNANSVALEDGYQLPTITGESEVVANVMGQIKAISESPTVLEINGDHINLDKELVESWITFDDDNKISIDQDKVRAYLETLDEKYSTFNKVRKFQSTLQGIVDIQPGILGWGIDIDKEVDLLTKDILAAKPTNREPAVISTGGEGAGEYEIGDTYVEIDLENQHMWLYVKGKVVVSTDIVSGGLGTETVPGAGVVNEMLQNTNLVGYNPNFRVNYSTPVSYWIRFDDNSQGIHDASWQGAFGGDVHTYSGSLGCINTPYDAVATIYDKVEIGTPVIVY